jgi:hypothetical protein
LKAPVLVIMALRAAAWAACARMAHGMPWVERHARDASPLAEVHLSWAFITGGTAGRHSS